MNCASCVVAVDTGSRQMPPEESARTAPTSAACAIDVHRHVAPLQQRLARDEVDVHLHRGLSERLRISSQPRRVRAVSALDLPLQQPSITFAIASPLSGDRSPNSGR